MKRTAQKWNYKKMDYEPYDLPEMASAFERDMETIVACANCGTKLEFGKCYTSKRIHTNVGFGYGVCGDCYEKELKLEHEWEKECKRKIKEEC